MLAQQGVGLERLVRTYFISGQCLAGAQVLEDASSRRDHGKNKTESYALRVLTETLGTTCQSPLGVFPVQRPKTMTTINTASRFKVTIK